VRGISECDTAATHPLLCDEAIIDVYYSTVCWNWCSGQVLPRPRRECKQSALTEHKKVRNSRLVKSRRGGNERLLGEDWCLGDVRYTQPAGQETGGDFVCDPHSHRITQNMWAQKRHSLLAPFIFAQLGHTTLSDGSHDDMQHTSSTATVSAVWSQRELGMSTVPHRGRLTGTLEFRPYRFSPSTDLWRREMSSFVDSSEDEFRSDCPYPVLWIPYYPISEPRSTRRHIPEDGILHSRRHEKFKSFMGPFILRIEEKYVWRHVRLNIQIVTYV
jgi:hypothetical protein